MVAGSGTGADDEPEEADHEKFALFAPCPVKFQKPGVSSKPVAVKTPAPKISILWLLLGRVRLSNSRVVIANEIPPTVQSGVIGDDGINEKSLIIPVRPTRLA